MRKVSSWRGQGVSPRAWLRAGRGSWLSFDGVQIKGSSRTSRDSHSPRSFQIDNLEVILELIPGGAESKPMHAFLVGFCAFPKLVTLMAFGESSVFRHVIGVTKLQFGHWWLQWAADCGWADLSRLAR
jgi:hypothetical protein